MNLFHLFGHSSKVYIYPVLIGGNIPQTFLERGFRSPAHRGPFVNAIDFALPNPFETPLPILAPASGKIVALVQHNTAWGNSKDFQPYLNFVTVQVSGSFRVNGSEFYELAHIDANSCPFRLGATIRQGDLIAKTGVNGWITVTRGVPDFHLHFMVGVWQKNNKFQSLKVRYTKHKG